MCIVTFLLLIYRGNCCLLALRRPSRSGLIIRNIEEAKVIFPLQSLLRLRTKACAVAHVVSTRILFGVLPFHISWQSEKPMSCGLHILKHFKGNPMIDDLKEPPLLCSITYGIGHLKKQNYYLIKFLKKIKK